MKSPLMHILVRIIVSWEAQHKAHESAHEGKSKICKDCSAIVKDLCSIGRFGDIVLRHMHQECWNSGGLDYQGGSKMRITRVFLS
jgi:hypothetical protein